MKVDVKADVEIRSDGKTVTSFQNSPTYTLRKYIIDALHTGTNLAKFGKVAFMDTYGATRDSTTSLTISKPADNQVKVDCSITATASYDVGYVILYDVNNATYFNIQLPTPYTVTGGTTVNVSITITVNVSVTTLDELSGGMVSQVLGRLIAGVLSGVPDPTYGNVTPANLQITDIKLAASTGTVQDATTMSKSRVSDTGLLLQKDFNVTSAATITNVDFVTNLGSVLSVSISKSYSTNTRLRVTGDFRT